MMQILSAVSVCSELASAHSSLSSGICVTELFLIHIVGAISRAR